MFIGIPPACIGIPPAGIGIPAVGIGIPVQAGEFAVLEVLLELAGSMFSLFALRPEDVGVNVKVCRS